MVREKAYKGENSVQRHLPPYLSLIMSKHGQRELDKYEGGTDLEKLDEFMKPFLLRDREEADGYRRFRKFLVAAETQHKKVWGTSLTVKGMEHWFKVAPMLTDEGQERLKQTIIERVRAEEEGRVKPTWKQRISRWKSRHGLDKGVNEANEKYSKKKDDDPPPSLSR